MNSKANKHIEKAYINLVKDLLNVPPGLMLDIELVLRIQFALASINLEHSEILSKIWKLVDDPLAVRNGALDKVRRLVNQYHNGKDAA